MSTQSITTQFPGQSNGAGLTICNQDALNLTNNPSWTAGATAIVATSLGGPEQAQDWDLISATIQAYLQINPTSFANVFGKLGKIVACLIPNYTGSNIGGVINFNNIQPMLQLPSDLTLSGSLFDPAVDPLPPIKSPKQLSDCLAVSTTIYPTEPLPIVPGSPIAAGIWMLPSLLGSEPLADPGPVIWNVLNASCTINYDDGL